MPTRSTNKEPNRRCSSDAETLGASPTGLIDQVDDVVEQTVESYPGNKSGNKFVASDSQGPPADWSQRLDQKLSEISITVERQLNQFLIGLDQKINRLIAELEPATGGLTETVIKRVEPTVPKAVIVGDTSAPKQISAANAQQSTLSQNLSDWDRRKQEMLAEHGVSNDGIDIQTPTVPLAKSASKPFVFQMGYEPSRVESKNSSAKVDLRRPPRLGDSEEGPALDALHDSIAKLDKIDVTEIESLKEQLTSKLRDAEVELSINRAKLSQQWAALEQKQCEISQRESSLESKYGDLTGAPKKTGVLDRFARHLSRGSNE